MTLLLPWLLLCWHLSGIWSLSPQYEYGWLVPPLAAYLFFRRWKTMPVNISENGRRGSLAVAIIFGLLFLPVWVILTATPDWSVINFCLALVVAGFMISQLSCMEGGSIARHLAFPVLFIFCAVPWPQRMENWIIQSLTVGVATSTAELLQWMGFFAEQKGNLVFLGHSSIDISEACSGVRSIQAMLMASLFLGELRRLKAGPRLVLMATGIGLALFFNLLRNTILALLLNHLGPERVENWHDPAGWLILLFSFGCLLFMTKWLGKSNIPEERPYSPVCALPAWFGVVVAVWFFLIISGNEIWYRTHECNIRRSIIYIHWPRTKLDFHTSQVSDRVRDVTLCSEALSASWRESEGEKWTLTSLQWAPGATAAGSARVHQPDVCLRAYGALPVRKLPDITIPVAGGAIPFQAWLFEYARHPVFVYYTLWENGNQDHNNGMLLQDWSAKSRIQRALTGQRNFGQQSLEIALEGYESEEASVQAFQNELPQLISFGFSAMGRNK